MIVSLLHPRHWIPQGHWEYTNQLQNATATGGQWSGTRYHVNDAACREADMVVVHDDVDEKITVKASLLVLVVAEEKSIKLYDQRFIDQFDLVITSRDDISHPNLVRMHYLHPWWIRKTYPALLEMDRPQKTRNLSAIISDSTYLAGHRLRFAFINKLKGHFKDELDWFGKSENRFLQDKWDGLRDYRYSIAIENSSHENYFTEKISDCFLSYTMPFYWGCPNLSDFFDPRSYILLDINDYKKSIAIIEDAIKDNLAEKNAAYVVESRLRILEKYSFIPALTAVLETQRQGAREKKTVRAHKHFTESTVRRLVIKPLRKIFPIG